MQLLLCLAINASSKAEYTAAGISTTSDAVLVSQINQRFPTQLHDPCSMFAAHLACILLAEGNPQARLICSHAHLQTGVRHQAPLQAVMQCHNFRAAAYPTVIIT
jgi:hypothetical protein